MASIRDLFTLQNLKYLGQQLLLALMLLYLIAVPFILWLRKYPFGWRPHIVVRFIVTAYFFILLWGCILATLFCLDLLLYDYLVLGKLTLGPGSRLTFHVGDSLAYDLFGALIWIGSAFAASYAVARTFIAAYPKWANICLFLMLPAEELHLILVNPSRITGYDIAYLIQGILMFCGLILFAWYGADLGQKKRLSKEAAAELVT